jgi:hypothetical protein
MEWWNGTWRRSRSTWGRWSLHTKGIQM